MTKQLAKSKDFIMKKSLSREGVYYVFIFSILLLLFYITIVGRTVFATVARKSSSVELKNKMAEVASLEVEYIKKTKDLTKERAYEIGLLDIKSISYAKNENNLTLVNKENDSF